MIHPPQPDEIERSDSNSIFRHDELNAVTENNLAVDESNTTSFVSWLCIRSLCCPYPLLSFDDYTLNSVVNDAYSSPKSSTFHGKVCLCCCPCYYVATHEVRLIKQYSTYSAASAQQSTRRIFCRSCCFFPYYLLKQNFFIDELKDANSVKFSWETKHTHTTPFKDENEDDETPIHVNRKVVLLGSSGSGKSSIFARMVNENFTENEDESLPRNNPDTSATIGIRSLFKNNNNNLVFLEIWDTPPDGERAKR